MQVGKPFRFHTPSSILVVGPLGCGKTVFMEKLLLENADLFETLLPKCIIHLLWSMARPIQTHARSWCSISRRYS